MRNGYRISWTKLTMLSLCIMLSVLSIVLMKQCAYLSDRVDIASTYINELEEQLVIDNISIDDTVGEGDAYSEYYNI